MGIPRRASGMGLVRGGIFAAMADRPTKASRMSTGSRVSFADQPSPSSMRFDDLSTSRREDELERSLQQQGGGYQSFVSASGIDLATARAIRRLDDLTRQSFFSEDGQLQFDDEHDDEEEDGDGEEAGDQSDARRRKSLGRSMSEPLDGESSVVIFDDSFGGDADDYPQQAGSEEDEVSDSLPLEAGADATADDHDSDGEARRLAADTSTTSLPPDATTSFSDGGAAAGDDSRVSRVSFADTANEVSFQVDDAYSSDEDVQYGLSSAAELDEGDDDDSEEEGEQSNRRLDLLDPKDLNALLKRRIVKKRKSRISPITGAPVPPLPTSVMRDIFSSFLTPSSASTNSSSSLLNSGGGSSNKRAKLDPAVMEELDSAAHDFFSDFATNLLTQARTRTSRKSTDAVLTINEADAVAVLKRQGRVTQRHDASLLAHKLLPREMTDLMELSRWAKVGTVQTTLGAMLGGGGGGGKKRAGGGGGRGGGGTRVLLRQRLPRR